jgi:hypothetical protein
MVLVRLNPEFHSVFKLFALMPGVLGVLDLAPRFDELLWIWPLGSSSDVVNGHLEKSRPSSWEVDVRLADNNATISAINTIQS